MSCSGDRRYKNIHKSMVKKPKESSLKKKCEGEKKSYKPYMN